MVIELPTDFPHQAPKGYKYEILEFKRNVIAIWTVCNPGFVYNGGNDIRCIWGFYNTKKRQYHSPINFKKVGEIVDVNKTTAYTAMPILKPLRVSILDFI
jgi:hypothetical protein